MTSLSIIPQSTTNPEVETFSAAAFPQPYIVVKWFAILWPVMHFHTSRFLLSHRGQKSSYFFHQLRRYKRLSYYSINRSRWKNSFNSRLFTSNMVIIMTFISGRRSFTFLTSWKPVNAGILISDTKTWQDLQSFSTWCNAASGSTKAWTLKPTRSKLLRVTVNVSMSSSTINTVVFSLFFFNNYSCNL